MSPDIRVAVFSDVHGNLEGLAAVLDDMGRFGSFDRIVAAGDHCLNGPDPAECLDRVMDVATDALYGNTDRDIVDEGANDPDLGQKKADTIGWTRERIGERRIETLSGLDFSAAIDGGDGSRLLVVHANPHDVDRHIFPDASEEDLEGLVGGIAADVLAFGHLHIPYVRNFRGLTLANIAAAGLPRDGDRRSTWGEFSWCPGSGWSVVTHRIEYDYQTTVRKIFESGMPHPERRAQDVLRAIYE